MIGPILGVGEILWDFLRKGKRAGGAPFNFAFHCHQLGHPAYIVSRVGDDELGRELLDEVHKLGLSDKFIQIDRDHPTGTVPIHLDEAGQARYSFPLNVAWDFLEWDSKFEPLIRSASAICFGTLAQRSPTSRQTIRRLVTSARAEAITICDLNFRPPFVSREVIEDSLEFAKWLKLNDGELRETAEMFALQDPLEDLLRQGRELVCVTRGEKGCRIATPNETIDLPGLAIEVEDTVGAGDSFTAGLLTQTLEGKPLTDAARFATVLAGLVASRPGGTPRVSRQEIERLC
ncbi:MAG: carbohydrate kinase [Planctomycetes bacterium]|nr:carbohydrate kinase [Planctomycetota bacterium]